MLGLIDESAPETIRGVHYVIGAAVLLEPGRRDDVRMQAQRIVEGRARCFRWKDEGIERRRAMVELLGELEVGVFAVIHEPVRAQRQGRARHSSLWDLTTLLCKEGVDELLIESRGPQDAEDRRTLMAAIQGGAVPADLTYDFAGKDEALMWLPDAVAGIVGEAERRKDGRWIEDLQDAAAVFDVRRVYAHEPRLPS